jgi:phage tail tape-measure protein
VGYFEGAAVGYSTLPPVGSAVGASEGCLLGWEVGAWRGKGCFSIERTDSLCLGTTLERAGSTINLVARAKKAMGTEDEVL